MTSSLTSTNSTSTAYEPPASLGGLLSENQGVVIGEQHNERASSQYLIESMEAIQKLGVRYLFVEDLPFDLLQADVNAFMNSRPEAAMPKKLANHLHFRDVCFTAHEESGLLPSEVSALQKKAAEGDEGAQQTLKVYSEKEAGRMFNRTHLYKKAKECGIQIIQLDHSKFKSLQGKARLEHMNAFASEVIHSAPLKKGEKFIALTGIAHSTTTMKTPGLKERIKAPVIHILTHKKHEERERLSAPSITYQSGKEKYQVDLAIIMPQMTEFDERFAHPSQENIDFFG